jgi:hypothetical protein
MKHALSRFLNEIYTALCDLLFYVRLERFELIAYSSAMCSRVMERDTRGQENNMAHNSCVSPTIAVFRAISPFSQPDAYISVYG